MSEQFFAPLQFIHELGHVEGRLAILEKKVDRLEQHMEQHFCALSDKIENFQTLLDVGRGSWKTLLLLATLMASLITFIQDAI